MDTRFCMDCIKLHECLSKEIVYWTIPQGYKTIILELNMNDVDFCTEYKKKD